MKPLSRHCFDYLAHLNPDLRDKERHKEQVDAFMSGAHSVLATIQWALLEQEGDELIREVIGYMVEEVNLYMQEHHPEDIVKRESH